MDGKMDHSSVGKKEDVDSTATLIRAPQVRDPVQVQEKAVAEGGTENNESI
jgi:hypothetical protein